MAQKLRQWTYGQAAVHRVFTPMLRPKLRRRGEMIEFLAQMPSETMIFITTALLGLGGNAARGEMADLSRVLINAQIASILNGAGRPPQRIGPARFGSYRRRLHDPVPTVRIACRASGPAAVTAVTTSLRVPTLFFGRRLIEYVAVRCRAAHPSAAPPGTTIRKTGPDLAASCRPKKCCRR
jgi:hypothetical protein